MVPIKYLCFYNRLEWLVNKIKIKKKSMFSKTFSNIYDFFHDAMRFIIILDIKSFLEGLYQL